MKEYGPSFVPFQEKDMNKNKKPGLGSEGDKQPVTTPPEKQLLPEQAEEYLRESGNIEDMPTPEQEKEADQETGKNRPKK